MMRRFRIRLCMIAIVAMQLSAVAMERLHAAAAPTLAQLVEGAKKEGTLKGQGGPGAFGGSVGFGEIMTGMHKKYGLNLKGQCPPGPDMQRLMLRIAQEAAAGQPASTDVYLGNSPAILDAMPADGLKPMDGPGIPP